VWERMKRRVRLPWVGLAVPTGIISLAAAAVVAGAALKISNKPLFCVSCHEMSIHYKTWSVSSHKDVECEECHVMPGMINMARTKLAATRQVYKHVKGGTDPYRIQGHVPDANCKKCHRETREMVVYHGLKITHRRHWDRKIGCTVCHANVVHGENAATKNTPSMQTCFKCHDGRKASNVCGTCHETLGVRRATPFSPEWVAGHKEEARQGGDSCKRCHHQDFCNNCHTMATPHPGNWLDLHPAAYRRDPGQCAVCHPKNIQSIFCGDCHKVRRAHSTDWIAKHPTAVREQPAACDACHKKDFCSDCHSRYRSHPTNWLQRHPGEAKTHPEKCKTCHAEYFCLGCHQNKVPESHKSAGWLQGHSVALRLSKGTAANGCKTCHKPDFCMSCHRSRKPASHTVSWGRLHATEAARNPISCTTCHTKDACQRCHGLPMPHPSGWITAHRPAAKANRGICIRCHKQEACTACHRGSRPESHRANWISAHGAVARASDVQCLNCHTRELCTNCHKNTRPASHGSSWLRQHGRAGGRCEACHGRSSCETCHKAGRIGRPSSHGRDWLKAHGRTAKTDQRACEICHSQQTCIGCHKTPMPHQRGWAMGGHRSIASFAKGSLCWKCHQRTKCEKCHERA